MRFLDLFSGIGGFRLGLEMAGHECVGHVEIDKYANQSYRAIHKPKEREFFHEDITTITDESIRELRDRGIDIIAGGFPCQAFSIAGKRAGFEDTRGTLFFNIARIAKEIKPKYLFLENVKGLLNSKTPMNFYDIIEVINNEIVGGTLWEEKFSPISNWDILRSNISYYLSDKLQMNLIFQNLKLDTSSKKDLGLVYGLTEQKVESGLIKRLRYLETQISQTMKKQNNYQKELMHRSGDKEEDWVSTLKRLFSIENLNMVDISMLEKAIVINGEIELLLNKKSEENLSLTKSYTTSTELKQTIDQKICTFVQELNILLFIIKQWKLSTNLWKMVMSDLMKKKEGMYYVGTFNIIINTLSEIGYDAEWQVLNSKHFGIPQNRERVFIIGHLRGSSTRKVFPFGSECKEIDELQGQHIGTITTRTGVNGTVGTYIIEGEQFSQKINQIGNLIDTDSFGGNPQVGRVYGTDGISPCLNTMGGGGREPKVAIPVLTPDRAEKRQNGRRFNEDGEPMFTLTAQDRHGVAISDQRYVDGISDKHSFAKKKAQAMLNEKGELPERFNPYNAQEIDEVSPTLTANCDRSTNSSTVLMKQPNFRIRKLTPKECWRLQGFPDWAFERAKAAGGSDSQLYKQAGNSVTVNVVYEIAKRLK